MLVRSLPVRSLAMILGAGAFGAGAPEGLGFGPTVRGVADSMLALREARDAQGSFEGLRIRTLPYAPSSPGPCTARVGRFCHYHDEEREEPPPEPVQVRSTRDSLIRLLGAIAAEQPGDEWIAGQRVRYLIDAGRVTEAVLATNACRATAWWCDALAGLARHTAESYETADQHFTAMLHAMPQGERCRWSDLSLVLEPGIRRAYEQLDCPARARIESRFWWLADPLYATPGNERRTEHFARLTMTTIQLAGRRIFDGGESELRELWTRYGVPRFYTRDATNHPPPANIIITGHEPSPAYRFTPVVPSLDSLFDLHSVQWELRDVKAQERYALERTPTFVTIEPAFTAFRRSDSTLVIATYEVHDERFPRDSTDGALSLMADERATPAIGWTHRDWPDGVVAVTAAGLEQLASVELFAGRTKTVARARRVIRAPALERDGVTISDLLLFDAAGDSVPETLAEVLPHVRTSDRITGAGKLGLYFELYGLPSAGTSVPISLTLEERGTGTIRRLAQKLGLAKRISPLSLRWNEVPRKQEVVSARTLAVDLSLTPRGRYRLQIEISPLGKQPVRAVRNIEITGGP